MKLSDAICERAKVVRQVILDVDGVLTNGQIVYTSAGDEIKAFHVQDGAAIKLLLQNGVGVAIITGRSSPIVARRAAELGIERVIQGAADKSTALDTLIRDHAFDPDTLACVGDDLADIALFERCRLAISVPNGHPAAQHRAHYVTELSGGTGVVREIAELLLTARGDWPYPYE